MNKINNVIDINDKCNNLNPEINYNELKEISIKTFNINFDELKSLERNFNIHIIKKIYNDCNHDLKVKILFNCPEYHLIILNDFLKFIYEIVQKKRVNVSSMIFNFWTS
jgi:hypothetical protein